ncbi:hypothetical protein ACF3NT_13625 [Naumannella halotolerans]|uniref:hypothetical protein n=1 Tax=Naumannella halotolerans TaxID=993414 RepID=UPI00370D9D36
MKIDAVPEPNLATLREVFNRLRHQSGQSYDDLAEASGLSRRTLINIGTGTTHGDLRTWLILARTWSKSMDELLAPVWE